MALPGKLAFASRIESALVASVEIIAHRDKPGITAGVTKVFAVYPIDLKVYAIQHQLAAFAGAVYFNLYSGLVFSPPFAVELLFHIVIPAQVARLTGDWHVGHFRDIGKARRHVGSKGKSVGLSYG